MGKENILMEEKVKKNLTVLLLVGVMCFLGATTALAYNEAPMLRVKVAAGELPPLEERLPDEPSVFDPSIGVPVEIGQYGGTVNVFATNDLPWQDLRQAPEIAHYLLRFGKDGTTIEGDLAKGYELSDDAKSLTLYLRKGAKWSDGAPFTADDILFMVEDMTWNKEVASENKLPEVKRIKKIDDYTVRYEMDDPFPLITIRLATWIGGVWHASLPKHYLKKWHIDYNPKANELAKEEGFDNWVDCLNSHWISGERNLQDLNTPTLEPWVTKKISTTMRAYERNPYYWMVDSAGNQLPYIDRIVSTVVNSEVYNLKIISGEADVAYYRTSFENYSLYKENEDAGNYRVVLIPGACGADSALGLNQNHPNPVLRKLYQDVRFRRALSVAINREEVNETVYFGQGVARQGTVIPSISYYKEEWAKAYAQYDPDEANRLLDEMGLVERDKNGFRLGPDGEPMLLMAEYTTEVTLGSEIILEMVKEYWGDVGINLLLRPLSQTLWTVRRKSSDHGIIVASVFSADEISNYFSNAEYWVLDGSDFSWAWNWGAWERAAEQVRTGDRTLEDFEGGKLPGEEPPEEIKELNEWARLRSRTELGSEEYTELSQKIFDFHAENVFMIGIVGMSPHPYIAKKNIGNIPHHGPGIGGWSGDLNYFASLLFFKE